MSTTVIEDRALDATDRCDRCGAQAYLRVTQVSIEDPMGYVISVIMIVLSILALWMAARVMKGKDYSTLQKGGGSLQRRKLGGWESALAYGWIVFILMVTLAPHIGILLMSLSKVWSFSVLPDSYTLAHYGTVFTDAKLMIVNTLKYCTMAAGLDVILGTTIAYLIYGKSSKIRNDIGIQSASAVLLFLLLLVVSFLQFRVLERRVHYGD